MGVLFQSGLIYSYFYWFFGVLLLYISLYLCVNTLKTDLMGIVSEFNSSISDLSHDIQTPKTTLFLKELIGLHNDMLM